MKTDNELIAEFMGNTIHKEAYGGSGSFARSWNVLDPFTKEVNVLYGYEMGYNTSWDCLMPVVQKIYKLYDEFEFTTVEQENMFLDVLHSRVMYPISTMHTIVVKFIRWYNTTQQPQKSEPES